MGIPPFWETSIYTTDIYIYIYIYMCVCMCIYIYMYITIVNGFCKPTWNWGGLALQHFVEKYSYQLSSYHPETRGCFMGI